jgi:hypothetical protein
MTTSVVVAGTIAATGLTVLNNLLQGKVSMRPVIAGFVVGTFLLLMAFFNTQIAAALALLLLLTSMLVNGLPLLQKVIKPA